MRPGRDRGEGGSRGWRRSGAGEARPRGGRGGRGPVRGPATPLSPATRPTGPRASPPPARPVCASMGPREARPPSLSGGPVAGSRRRPLSVPYPLPRSPQTLPPLLQPPPPPEMKEELLASEWCGLAPAPWRGLQKLVFPPRLPPRAQPGRGHPRGPGLAAPGDPQGGLAERVRRPCLLSSLGQVCPLNDCRPWGQFPQPSSDPACRDSSGSARPNARCVFTPGRVSPAFALGPFSPPPPTRSALRWRKDCFRLRVVLKFPF